VKKTGLTRIPMKTENILTATKRSEFEITCHSWHWDESEMDCQHSILYNFKENGMK
jgi:hypothetical protein